MKTSPTFKVVMLFGAMLIVIAAQWRANSQLRQENRALPEVREQAELLRAQAEQSRTELEQTAQASAHHESDAQALRKEVGSLQTELQTIRQALTNELAKAQTLARKGGATPKPLSYTNMVRTNWPPSRERTVFHMNPAAHTNLESVSPKGRYHMQHSGLVDDIAFWHSITSETIMGGPDWHPSQSLPLSFADGEKVARAELRKIVSDEPNWEVTQINLHQLGDDIWKRPLSGGPGKWHYGFTFSPIPRTGFDGFTVYVNMGGVPGTSRFQGDERY